MSGPAIHEMLLNERWLWLGETGSADECGITVFRAHPGAWWIVADGEMIGQLDDRSVLRALRIACTPAIDGCERGPTKLGVADLAPRRPFHRGQHWQSVGENDLPPSVTTYDSKALEPVTGCCTTFDAMPEVAWTSIEGWDAFLEERPARGGRLSAGWNAHPAGCLVFVHGVELESGFVVVDVPEDELAPAPPSPKVRP